MSIRPLAVIALIATAPTWACAPLALYDETTSVVTANFYDRAYRGLPWKERVALHRQGLTCESTNAAVALRLNALLAELETSHTGFYTPADLSYWALKNIFARKIDAHPFPQIGLWATCSADDGCFARNVYEGSIAEKAGLRVGDQLLKLDDAPFDPLGFRVGGAQRLLVRSRAGETPRSLAVRARRESAQRALLRATRKAMRLYERGGRKIGYVHLWAGTHPEIQATFVSQLKSLAGRVDAIVVDLRDGFGGASPDFVAPLYEDERLRKTPVVALVNDGTRSGKEWVAYRLKRDKRATLLGETTAGYFIGGRIYDIRGGDFALYLAVEKFDPEDVLDPIEGVGVAPDVESPGCRRFCEGRDPQLEDALARLAKPSASGGPSREAIEQ